MKAVKISENEMNYLKDDGSYLLDEHVYLCYDFREEFGVVQYNDDTDNFVNSEGKTLLKTNVNYSSSFYDGFAIVGINNTFYYIDKECNFYIYDEDDVSFKELYHKYHNMRSELIEIIEKYTYYNTEEYFV